MSRSRQRERKILDAAASLFGERSPEAVTMEEVAQRAGVAKGTLYLYFPSKEDMVQRLLSSRLDALIEGVDAEASRPGDAWTRLRRAVDFTFRAQVDSADWFRMRRRTECAPTTPGDQRRGRLRASFRTLVRELAPESADSECNGDLVLGAIDAAVRRCIEGRRRRLECESGALWRFVRRALDGERLAGRTVLVTREEDEDGALSSALRARGAAVRRVQLLETAAPEDPEALRREAGDLGSYDWVLLTSARAVRALADTSLPNGGPRQLAVVGEATARCARDHGWEPAVVGHAGGAELVASMRDAGVRFAGTRVLFPAADRVRAEATRILEEAGADVHVVTAYRTLSRPGAGAELVALLRSETVDAVTFGSPSAVEAWSAAVAEAADVAPVTVAAVIGSTTATAAEGLGFDKLIVAPRPDFESLAEALADAFDAGEA